MLAVLHRYSRADTLLVFTVFLDTFSSGGHGMIDQYSKALGHDARSGERYVDFRSNDVLRVALYSEEYAREIIDGSGWTIVSIKEPTPYAQHLFTLRPDPA